MAYKLGLTYICAPLDSDTSHFYWTHHAFDGYSLKIVDRNDVENWMKLHGIQMECEEEAANFNDVKEMATDEIDELRKSNAQQGFMIRKGDQPILAGILQKYDDIDLNKPSIDLSNVKDINKLYILQCFYEQALPKDDLRQSARLMLKFIELFPEIEMLFFLNALWVLKPKPALDCITREIIGKLLDDNDSIHYIYGDNK